MNTEQVNSTLPYDLLHALTPLIADLAVDLPAELRYERLLTVLRRLLPCDAVALLRLEDNVLAPVSIHGLSPDTLGRRYRLDDQPRLQALLQAPGALLFPPDCDLPDPYDGLIPAESGQLKVHDCMGCALRVNGQIWGVLTLDALEAGHFLPDDLQTLETFASLAAATVAAADRLVALTLRAEGERRKAEAYRQALMPERRTLTGQSAVMKQLRSEIDLVASSDLTVLVTGETGVGKELVVRQLHARSLRADKPLVSVNCAALPDNLVESELFGHVRGAFSGAVADRPGKFEVANGGTLFLDEVGELPLAAQAKLLRVLQDGQLQRLGSDREHHADIRLIAATNRDLADEVRAGRFRADLYHRLSVFLMRVPPLRERGRDVLLLAGTFIEENRRRMGLRGLRLSAGAQAALQAHAWPGNVRELQYLVARATLKAKGRHPARERQGIVTLDIQDLDIEGGGALTASRQEGAKPSTETFEAAREYGDLRTEVDAFQRRLVSQALMQYQGNVAAAARSLGQDRANLVRLAARLGISLTTRKSTAA